MNRNIANANPSSVVVDFAGGDDTLQADFTSAIDQGAIIAGITDGFVLIVQEEEMPDASVGAAYQASLSASGGIKPYTWAVVEDTLPNGLSISASGEISGTPTSEALYQTQSVIEVTDYVGTTTRVIVPFTTNHPSEPTLIDPKLSASRLSSPMDIHFPAVGDISGLDALGSQLGTPNIRGSIGIGVNDATTTSFERAVAGNDYLSFTVTPNDGQSLHLSAITFKATKRDIVSVDEYALADDSTAFETITEATTFRLYAWGRSTDTTSATLSTVDKLTLYGRSAAESAYLEWVLDHGLTGDDTLPNSDIENGGRGDGYSNFLEFALNMNPSQADAGSQEAAFTELAGENQLFVYQYHRRTDHAALDLNYLQLLVE